MPTTPQLSIHKSSNIFRKPQNLALDSNSFTIGIDDNESTTISNRSINFIGPITPVKGNMVKGFGGVVQVMGEGTILWKIEDDDGVVHTIKIWKHYTYQKLCNAYYNHKNGPRRQTTITQILAAHDAPPMHTIASCTGSKKGTAVPSPGIHP